MCSRAYFKEKITAIPLEKTLAKYYHSRASDTFPYVEIKPDPSQWMVADSDVSQADSVGAYTFLSLGEKIGA